MKFLTKPSPLLAILALASIAVTAEPAHAQTQTRSFAVYGPSSDADLTRLREALGKVDGVEQMEFVKRAGGVSLQIRGNAPQQALSATAMAIGFDLMSPPMRTYVAVGPSSDADLMRLRQAVEKATEKAAEKTSVQIDARSGGATLRVRGDIEGSALVAAAKSAGFEMRRESSYVASGGSSDADYKRLSEALNKVQGVENVEVRKVAGGAAVLIVGEIEDEAVITGAKSAGYGLRTLGSAASQSTALSSAGGADAERTTPPAPTGERDPDSGVKVGERAPDFTLIAKDGKGAIRLSDYQGKKPVVLVFGSYTCPPFRQRVVLVDEIYQKYKERVTFLFVYIRKAHPESILLVPTSEGGKRLEVVSQTATAAERLKNLDHCVSRLQLTMPALIDGDDNAVKRAYAAWPIRLYGIGMDGVIAYKSGPGPGGFRPPDLEDWLRSTVK